jgi:hypothetical protein
MHEDQISLVSSARLIGSFAVLSLRPRVYAESSAEVHSSVSIPYITAFEPHTVGLSLHKEYWIPAERLLLLTLHFKG